MYESCGFSEVVFDLLKDIEHVIGGHSFPSPT